MICLVVVPARRVVSNSPPCNVVPKGYASGARRHIRNVAERATADAFSDDGTGVAGGTHDCCDRSVDSLEGESAQVQISSQIRTRTFKSTSSMCILHAERDRSLRLSSDRHYGSGAFTGLHNGAVLRSYDIIYCRGSSRLTPVSAWLLVRYRARYPCHPLRRCGMLTAECGVERAAAVNLL